MPARRAPDGLRDLGPRSRNRRHRLPRPAQPAANSSTVGAFVPYGALHERLRRDQGAGGPPVKDILSLVERVQDEHRAAAHRTVATMLADLERPATNASSERRPKPGSAPAHAKRSVARPTRSGKQGAPSRASSSSTTGAVREEDLGTVREDLGTVREGPRHRPRGPRHRPRGPRHRPRGPRHRPRGPRHRHPARTKPRLPR